VALPDSLSNKILEITPISKVMTSSRWWKSTRPYSRKDSNHHMPSSKRCSNSSTDLGTSCKLTTMIRASQCLEEAMALMAMPAVSSHNRCKGPISTTPLGNSLRWETECLKVRKTRWGMQPSYRVDSNLCNRLWGKCPCSLKMYRCLEISRWAEEAPCRAASHPPCLCKMTSTLTLIVYMSSKWGLLKGIQMYSKSIKGSKDTAIWMERLLLLLRDF
jgi:hypothetical protein